MTKQCKSCGHEFDALVPRQRRCVPCRSGSTQYRIRCVQCRKWYDGRLGVEIGLCCERCQVAHEPKRRRAQANEVELWRAKDRQCRRDTTPAR